MTENLGYRLPPQDLSAEQSVIGAILLESNAVFEVIDVVDEEDFYRDAHKRIFAAIKRLVDKNEPVDLITLQDELKRTGELEAVGDTVYLSETLASVPTAANAAYYAKIIKEKSLERRLLSTCTSIVGDIYNAGYDTDTLLNEAESKIFEVTGGKISTPYFAVKDVTADYFKKIEELHQKGEKLVGVGTGYRDIDELTGGFRPGQLVVIAARPGVGKTSLALNFARNSAIKHGNVIAIFSLEMSKEEVLGRLLGSEARIDISRLNAGRIEENEWVKLTDAASRLSESMIFIDETSSISPGEVRAKCRRIKAQYNRLDMIIIDYMQLMRTSLNSKSQNREQEISEISRTLKAISKELSVPVIALSQLNRAIDKRPDRRPVLSDLRESGAIEQDADIVMFIHRGDEEDSNWEGRAEIIFEKNRSGPRRKISLTWLEQYTAFENFISSESFDGELEAVDF